MRFDALPRVVHLPSSSLAGLICKGVRVCAGRNGLVVRAQRGFHRKTCPMQHWECFPVTKSCHSSLPVVVQYVQYILLRDFSLVFSFGPLYSPASPHLVF